VLLLIGFLMLGYLVGSIPTGYWICRWWYGLDITHYGSGNIGASNVARVKGNKLFPIIFCCDAGKAYSVLWLMRVMNMSLESCFLGAGVLLIGNAYSIFMRLNGGRGVATAVGILGFFLPWPSTFGVMIAWLAIAAFTKKPFVASLGAFCGVMVTHVYMQTVYVPLLVGIVGWIVWRHASHLRAWYYSR
jgi:glycerol-3-phosphate acyltransferase PlsY